MFLSLGSLGLQAAADTQKTQSDNSTSSKFYVSIPGQGYESVIIKAIPYTYENLQDRLKVIAPKNFVRKYSDVIAYSFAEIGNSATPGEISLQDQEKLIKSLGYVAINNDNYFGATPKYVKESKK